MKYNKTPVSIDSQIDTLIKRGLKINDKEKAKKQIENIGYFRLTGYMYHLQSKDGLHQFKENTSFDHIIQHYKFDKKLRAIVMEYLERIEIALRARLTNYYSLKYGFYWYAEFDLYANKDVHEVINHEITENFEEPKERFLKAFKIKYSSERIPPSNMAMEILTLGKLARLYAGLNNNEEKIQIALDFGLPSQILSTWFIFLNNIRNICAHHGRLWNRGLSADRPVIPSRKKNKFHGTLPEDFNRSMYGVIAMIDRLLIPINPTNNFIEKITTLINETPVINTNYMGFPDNWIEEPAWKKLPSK